VTQSGETDGRCLLWVKADIGEGATDVRFTPKADIDTDNQETTRRKIEPTCTPKSVEADGAFQRLSSRSALP